MPKIAARAACSPPRSNSSRDRFAQRIERSIASRCCFGVDVVGTSWSNCHDDVRSEQPLDLDRPLRRQHVRAPVEVAGEATPSSLTLVSSLKAHHLIAAAVGQDRPLPAHEPVQPAELRHALGAGAKHQMIGVAEDDVGAAARTSSGRIALTVAAVPTGMNAGVRISPRSMAIAPVRAAPSVA